MSIRQGKKLIASSTTNGFSLFDCKWADHILNNMSWLRADTFSWQSGDVYVAAYEHLVGDYESIEKNILYAWNWSLGDGIVYTKTSNPSVGDMLYNSNGEVLSYSIVEMNNGTMYIDESSAGGRAIRTESADIDLSIKTDTIDDISITYCQAEDGHKICLPDQESSLSSLYESAGVAWYYVLDAENKQFKLPRTKFGFTGIRNGVGGYIEAGLPNITGGWNSEYNITLDNGSQCIGAISEPYSTGTGRYGASTAAAEWGYGFKFDASRSNSIYGNSETVQQPATEMYLYFYVGNYIEDLDTIDAGKLAEVVNDADFVVAFQRPTTANGYTWYRKYKSGWVEQGGSYEMTIGTANAQFSISLPVEMENVRYTASVNVQGGWATENVAQIEGNTTTVLSGYAKSSNSSTKYILWQVSGMSAQ